MTERPIVLPPLPTDITQLIKNADNGEDDNEGDIKAYATAAVRADRAAMGQTGAVRIACERERQLERWSAAHDDDEHRRGDLVVVAAGLAVYGTDARVSDPMERIDWQDGTDVWGLIAKHKDDQLRMLEIAGALIAAEIDRLLRLAEKR